MIFFSTNLISGSVLSEENKESSLVPSYVKALISDFHLNDKNTHDVAIIPLSKFIISSQKVHDLSKDIHKAIPDDFAVHLPPIGKVVEDRNLRVASFTIIISDVFNNVS